MDDTSTNNECKTRSDWSFHAHGLSVISEEDAIAKFKKTPEAHCLDNSDVIFEVLVNAIKAVRDGSAPDRISFFASKELKRILSTKTWTECVKYDVNDGLTDEEYKTADEKTAVMPYLDDIWTDQYGVWRQIVVSLAAFLREAAALAKRVGSIDASRKFILAWRKVNRLENGIFEYMSRVEANGVVNAINDAADILWADMELAKL